MSPRPTIKDVASLSGVAVSTVSRVLNGSSKISDATKERVMRAVEELGYMPNTAARCLKNSSSRLIGVVLPDISGEFYAACTSAIFHKAKENGYYVIIADTERDADFGAEAVRALMERQVDGIIFIGGGNDDETVTWAAQKGIPVVTGDRQNVDVPAVTFNNYDTVNRLVKALIDEGYKSFAYVGEPLSIQNNLIERYNGYRDAVEDNSNVSSVEFFDYSMHIDKLKGGYEICRKYFSETAPEVVITANDLIAEGILSAAAEMGKKINAVGFDNNRASGYWIPSVTTISQNPELLAEKCLGMLMDCINGREVRNVVLKQEIIVRESLYISEENLKKNKLL